MAKIAFLFLVISDLFHHQSWNAFFQNNEKNYSIYIHAKEEMPKQSPFKKFELPVKIPTEWGKIVKAELALLKAALKDPANEKFIFLSESTIPFKPFSYVYSYLTKNSLSEFTYTPNPHPERVFPPIPHNNVYKSSTWIVLSRKHAEMVAADETILEIMSKGIIADEHYFPTFLLHHNLAHEIIKNDCTFDFWPWIGKSNPYTYHDLITDHYSSKVIEAMRNPKTLFGRKFSKECDVSMLAYYVYPFYYITDHMY